VRLSAITVVEQHIDLNLQVSPPSSRSSAGNTKRIPLSQLYNITDIKSRTVAIPIGNAVFLNALGKYIPIYSDGIETQAVVHAGPLAIHQLSSSAITVHGIRLAYSKAVQHTMVFALVIICVSIPAASGMQWLNIKKVSKAREANNGIGPALEETDKAT
jgi:hypothetical protein